MEQKAEKMILRRVNTLILLAALVLSKPAFCRVIRVPSEQPTIQAGINAAVNGDTVLVEPGEYTGNGNYNIDFLSKAITVTSEAGPDSTVIEVDELGRGFYFHSYETEASILEGFKITGANVPLEGCGGGVFCYNASPTIRNNLITECYAYWGGGIACLLSSPIIDDNLITANTADKGGGIASLGYSTPLIRNNRITNNTAVGG